MPAAISAQGLTKRFGALTAVDHLSLEVERGELLGLLGPNGAGKTTTVKMLTGLLEPSAGEVLLDGEKIDAGSATLRRKLGVCPQDVVLWDRLTCLENLEVVGRLYELPAPAARARALELLEALDLGSKRDTQARRLSGGMKRRLNLAVALIHDPEIIVLDEPITGLDPQSRLLVSEYVRSLSDGRGRTIILTTHLMEVASALCHRIAIVDHGKLLVLDSHANLMKTVGRGDVVTIELGDGERQAQALACIEGMAGVEEASAHDGTVRFRALDAVNLLPEAFRALQGAGGEIAHLTLRGNTLEDVFITLTGRGLRE